MTPFYAIRVVDGRHQCGWTTDGRDFFPIKTAVYDKPRPAIDYCSMRQASISPLRSPDEEPASAPRPASQSVSSPAPLASLGQK